ncbi:hypothetical protein FACS1894217_03220 [Clostridia bacterium]|nr:hypothetical protein FACS1894217_03220 [Clostridia bacterium]
MIFDFSKTAKKELAALDMNTAGRVIKALLELPGKGDIKPLAGSHSGQFRLRVGNLRIIYTIEANIILIAKIMPRGDVYK